MVVLARSLAGAHRTVSFLSPSYREYPFLSALSHGSINLCSHSINPSSSPLHHAKYSAGGTRSSVWLTHRMLSLSSASSCRTNPFSPCGHFTFAVHQSFESSTLSAKDSGVGTCWFTAPSLFSPLLVATRTLCLSPFRPSFESSTLSPKGLIRWYLLAGWLAGPSHLLFTLLFVTMRPIFFSASHQSLVFLHPPISHAKAPLVVLLAHSLTRWQVDVLAGWLASMQSISRQKKQRGKECPLLSNLLTFRVFEKG